MPTDLQKLQGTWSITALEADGNTMTPSFFNGAHIVITDDRFESRQMGGIFEGTLRLDTKRKPKTIDIDYTAGQAAGTRQLGIYELKGNKWKLCLAAEGKQRPRVFATKANTGRVLETLVRTPVIPRSASDEESAFDAPDPEKQIPHLARGDKSSWEGEWRMISGIFGGVPMAESMTQWATRVTHGDITSVLAGPQVMLRARFTLDDSGAPTRVHYDNLEGSNKGKKQTGIAQLEGDTLRICMSAPGKPAPQDFASTKGDGRSFTTWRRVSR